MRQLILVPLLVSGIDPQAVCTVQWRSCVRLFCTVCTYPGYVKTLMSTALLPSVCTPSVSAGEYLSPAVRGSSGWQHHEQQYRLFQRHRQCNNSSDSESQGRPVQQARVLEGLCACWRYAATADML